MESAHLLIVSLSQETRSHLNQFRQLEDAAFEIGTLNEQTVTIALHFNHLFGIGCCKQFQRNELQFA